MIASVMSFCCRTVGAVQAPLTAPVMRQCGYYNTCSRLKPTPVGVGLQRFRRACTAAAPDGVAVRNSWGAQDRTTEIRELRSLNDWISSCASNWQGFTAYEGYAAIRKLVELLRDGRSRLEVQDKRAINDTCVGIFEKLLPHVSEFQPTDQQILVLELSQLGIVFISQEWHSFCPPVPVPLLNGLLDGLLMRLQKLRGDQVGVLLISLQRLQLSDRDAYTKILDEVENQLRAPGANSWYRKPENMGKLVRGVATVFLGIPKGMEREQACRVLNLMAEEVSELTKAAAGQDDLDFWASTCSIAESYAELYPVLPGLQCDGMFEEIGQLFINKNCNLKGKHLNQLARVYATKPFTRLKCSSRVIMQLFSYIRKAGMYSRLGGDNVSEIAESLSLGTLKELPRIENLMQWVLQTEDHISNEAGLRTLAASARVGLVTGNKGWRQFMNRYGAVASNPSQRYNSQQDREMQLLLDATISCSIPEPAVLNLVKVVAGWMDNNSMRLWRIAPYLTVMSRGAETYQSSMQLLFQHALSAMRKEISTNMMIAQRGQLLQQALAAFIVCGNPKYLSQLLSIENFNAHLEEQGGSASAVLAQSIIDASTVKGPGITPGKLHVQAVQLVWEQMLKVGEEMAAVLSAQSPSSDQHPTPLDALPPQTLCELFLILYEGEFSADFVSTLKPNASLLATLPENIAAEFSGCAEDGCTQAWISACLHFFPDRESHAMSTLKRSRARGNRGKAAAAEAPKPPPAGEPTAREMLQQMTVVSLKELLAEKGLKVSGNKKALIDRLLEHDPEYSPVAATESAASPVDAAAENNFAPSPQVTAAAQDAPEDTPADVAVFKKKTVPQLKDLLRDNNLKVSGNKAELVDRCLANGLSVV